MNKCICLIKAPLNISYRPAPRLWLKMSGYLDSAGLNVTLIAARKKSSILYVCRAVLARRAASYFLSAI